MKSFIETILFVVVLLHLLFVLTCLTPLIHMWLPVAPPGIFIGGAKSLGVWGRGPENFSLTTPSNLAIIVANAPFIG